MIVRIVSIVPVVPRSVQMIRTTETIAGFHMIVSIAPKTEVARSSAMFLGPTKEFWRDIRKTNRPFYSYGKVTWPLTGSEAGVDLVLI